jgi:putative two-component system response regulator
VPAHDATTVERGGTSARVLVVEDDASVRDEMLGWLKAEGHVCAQADNFRAAWEHLAAHEVALAVLGGAAGPADGMELLERIAAARPDTAIVVTTDVEEVQTAIAALARGASAYLVKPVSRNVLLFHVRKALERRQLLLDHREYTAHLERQVREQTDAIRRAHEETIHRLLTASLWRGEETRMHLRRMGLVSELLALAAGWSAAEAECIRLAAPMHDLGKVGIADAILYKPAALFLEEFQTMKMHTIIGGKVLAGAEGPMLTMAREIALAHHERWDGEGYPAGLAGRDIPESARIVAIADVHDAVTHDRVYRPALSAAEALAVMQNGSGTRFDPRLLAAFLAQRDEINRIARDNPDEPLPAKHIGSRLVLRVAGTA